MATVSKGSVFAINASYVRCVDYRIDSKLSVSVSPAAISRVFKQKLTTS